jgi:predicted neuraminidase
MAEAIELAGDGIAAAMDGQLRPHPSEADRTDAFLPSPCVQNHAANLAFLPDGTLACVWFGGTMEGMGDISVRMSRLAPGAERWSPPERLSDEAGRSEQNPVLFVAPSGEVWLFYTSQPGGRQDLARVMRRRSADGGRTWDAAEALPLPPGTFVRQRPVVAGDGAWLLPGWSCAGRPGVPWNGSEDTAAVAVSRDGGRRWELVPVEGSLGAVHMNILPAGPGRWVALYRDRFAEHVRRSLSADDGRTWTAPAATSEPNNNSSIQAVRCRDGRIAMVYNPVSVAAGGPRRAGLYDEIEGGEQAPATAEPPARQAVWGVPRAPLTLAFSEDDGASFADRRDLATGSGACLSNNSREGLNRELSYPSIAEAPDGTLHVAFTHHRRAIRHLRLAPPRRG